MDFSLDTRQEGYRRRIVAFVDEHVLPLEAEPASFDAHENLRLDLLDTLRERAKREGLWCLQLPEAHGGQGLDTVGMAACYEAMNRSIFGPAVFNSAAPDDGNMMLLAKIGTAEQQAWWLSPLVEGRVRSAFAMTEPAPGSGSDPAGMMLTRARRDGDDWLIDGRKWYITGAEVAEHFIVVARTSDDARKGLTAFLFHRDDAGFSIERRIPIMGPEEHGGHCEVVFDGLRIADANRLLNVGDGLKVTQIRLGVARLTHCMRWLGLAKRCMEIATAHVAERRAFGGVLADRESVRLQLGQVAMQIEIGRLLTMRAARSIDLGSHAKQEVSMAKIAVADVLHDAADTAIQLLGAKGYSRDTPLEWIYRYARQARLVDGASEVHRMVLAGRLMEQGDAFWRWDPSERASDRSSE